MQPRCLQPVINGRIIIRATPRIKQKVFFIRILLHRQYMDDLHPPLSDLCKLIFFSSTIVDFPAEGGYGVFSYPVVYEIRYLFQ